MEGSKSKVSEHDHDPVRGRVEAALSEARQRRARGDVHGARELALSILAVGEAHADRRQLVAAVELASLPHAARPAVTPVAPMRPTEAVAAPVAKPAPLSRERPRPQPSKRSTVAVVLVSGVLLVLIAGAALLWRPGAVLQEAAAIPAAGAQPVASWEPPPLPAPSSSPAPEVVLSSDPPAAPVPSAPIRRAPEVASERAPSQAVKAEAPLAPQKEWASAATAGTETLSAERLKETTAGVFPVEAASVPPATTPLSPPARTVESDRQEILDTIRRYTEAMEARDLGALKAVWPAVAGEQEAKIRASFQFARSLRVRLEVQNVHVDGGAAIVLCRRRDVIVTTDGETLNHERPGIIKLVRSDAWSIAAIE